MPIRKRSLRLDIPHGNSASGPATPLSAVPSVSGFENATLSSARSSTTKSSDAPVHHAALEEFDGRSDQDQPEDLSRSCAPLCELVESDGMRTAPPSATSSPLALQDSYLRTSSSATSSDTAAAGATDAAAAAAAEAVATVSSNSCIPSSSPSSSSGKTLPALLSSPKPKPSKTDNERGKRFLKLESLGKGSCGTVQLALDVWSGKLVAIKTLFTINGSHRNMLRHEIHALRQQHAPLVHSWATNSEIDQAESEQHLCRERLPPRAEGKATSSQGSSSSLGAEGGGVDGHGGRVVEKGKGKTREHTLQPLLCSRILPLSRTSSPTTSPRSSAPSSPRHPFSQSCRRRSRSEFVVDFHGAFVSDDNSAAGLVMEYMRYGSLQDMIAAYGPGQLPEPWLAHVGHAVLSGLCDLETLGHMHRDVKPSNVLLGSGGQAKLADFGISHSEKPGSEDGGHVVDSECTSFVGTLVYMSPERLSGEHYTYNSDVWSLGVSLATCILGHPPFRAKATFWQLLSELTANQDPVIHRLRAAGASPLAVDFIQSCLVVEPRERQSALSLLSHPFIARRRAWSIEDWKRLSAPLDNQVASSYSDARLNDILAAAMHRRTALQRQYGRAEDKKSVLHSRVVALRYLRFQFGLPCQTTAGESAGALSDGGGGIVTATSNGSKVHSDCGSGGGGGGGGRGTGGLGDGGGGGSGGSIGAVDSLQSSVNLLSRSPEHAANLFVGTPRQRRDKALRMPVGFRRSSFDDCDLSDARASRVLGQPNALPSLQGRTVATRTFGQIMPGLGTSRVAPKGSLGLPSIVADGAGDTAMASPSLQSHQQQQPNYSLDRPHNPPAFDFSCYRRSLQELPAYSDPSPRLSMHTASVASARSSSAHTTPVAATSAARYRFTISKFEGGSVARHRSTTQSPRL